MDDKSASQTPVPSGSSLYDLAQISIASRIPEFWVEQPRLWFIQLESTLAAQKVGDDTKYHLVVTKLGRDVIAQLTDILLKPPETAKYAHLKERLLSIYEESEARKLQKLISEMELGDQRPSQLLSRMTDLARGKVSEDTLRLLWQGHLPAAVRAVLAVADTKDMDKLAKMADKVMENIRPTQVSEVSVAQGEPSTSATLGTVMAAMQRITARLDRIDMEDRRRTSSRNGNRSRSRSTSQRNKRSPDWLCYYHYRYRKRANKCVAPCNWKATSSAQQENQ